MLLRQLIGIQAVPEHKEPVIQKLQGKICRHIDDGHQVFIPVQAFREEIAKYRGSRRKHTVKGKNLNHGNRHVAGRLERVSAVQCKSFYWWT